MAASPWQCLACRWIGRAASRHTLRVVFADETLHAYQGHGLPLEQVSGGVLSIQVSASSSADVSVSQSSFTGNHASSAVAVRL